MTLRFYVRFASAWGQQLVLCLDNGQRRPMEYAGPEMWATALECGEAAIRYRYCVESDICLEEPHMREVKLPAGVSAISVYDTFLWPGSLEATWMKAPFTEIFFAGDQHGESRAATGTQVLTKTHQFRVRVPLLSPEKRVWLLGSTESLGNWAPDFAVSMAAGDNGVFTCNVDLPVNTAIAYKYCTSGGDDDWEWEQGENRTYFSEGRAVIDDGFVRFPRVPWKGAGVAVPVYSLRTQNGLGCGEFNDLPLLGEWAANVGLRMIQLLPVNDTVWTRTWHDSYPYAAVSAFALNPIYIHLPSLGTVETYTALQQQLDQEKMDFDATLAVKEQYLRAFYQHFIPDDAYQQWEIQQQHWLPAYTRFCCKRDESEDAGYYGYVQYQLHHQFADAAAKLRDKGIALKGDLPIGMFPQSADVQELPDLFDTSVQAGAPPDEFAAEGQNWGFPAYQWERMAAQHFTWWKSRLQHMAQYFSAFRIDHVLGFFRLWQVPKDAGSALLGYFHPAFPYTETALAALGIPFSRERYCRPYITDAVVTAVFGNDAESVKQQYLEPQSPGFYRIKPLPASCEMHPSIQAGLRQLAANVLFLEPQENQFHPRFNMADTLSFQALPPAEQDILRNLSNDFFYHRHDALWRQTAMQRLPVLTSATNMLVCGEDLGLIPHSVPEVMASLGILGLEVDRMPRYPGRTPADAPYLSVVTPSTHDMSTLRSEIPGDKEPAIRRQLLSPAMWCVLQLQDWLSLDDSIPHPENPDDERINVPSIQPWNWGYRIPLTLESLLEATSLETRMRALIQGAGRMHGSPD